MDIRKLKSFVKIIDIGSITRASAMLHIAQPALSQQIAALEAHYGRQLLIRSKRGVVPTEAGKVLYRHAQRILRQIDEAELDIASASEEITGVVRVGLAPLGLGALLAAQLIKKIRAEYPGIVLYVNENVGGGTMSELLMSMPANGIITCALYHGTGTTISCTKTPLIVSAAAIDRITCHIIRG